MSSFRLVLVIGSLNCGGAQRVIVDMANYWAAIGWEVTLTTWNSAVVHDFYFVSPQVERIDLAALSKSSSASRIGTFISLIGRSKKLRDVVVRKRPDAVLSFIDVSNVLTILACAFLNVRVVVSERTNPRQNETISGFWKVMRVLTYRRAARVVAQTGDAAKWLNSRCHVRTAVIPNSIRQMPAAERVRKSTILAVGRLSPEKGIDTLLRAYASIRNKIPEWRLIVAGDGPARPDLEDLRAELHLTGQVDFVGEVHDVENWFATAGLFVHASRREGFPNVLLEAMAMGVPVISTDCPSGPSDIIQDGVNGRLVAVDDIDGLAEAMIQLVGNPQVRGQLACEGLKVRDSYDQHSIMNCWGAALQELPGA